MFLFQTRRGFVKNEVNSSSTGDQSDVIVDETKHLTDKQKQDFLQTTETEFKKRFGEENGERLFNKFKSEFERRNISTLEDAAALRTDIILKDENTLRKIIKVKKILSQNNQKIQFQKNF